jgi:hypothetical protein
MHVRRALLLFAIVLGLAALVASLSAPQRGRQTETSESPSPDAEALLSPGPESTAPARIRFEASRKKRTLRLRAGRAAVVTVDVRKPGQVELEGLGLTAAAEPVTAARFDVLVSEPGRYPVRFKPAQGRPAETIGVLRVTRGSPAARR